MRTHASKPLPTKPFMDRPALHSSEWIQRFADCLMLLQPRTIAVTTARYVAATRPDARRLKPEDAAAGFVFTEAGSDGTEPH
jgi:hypothetical protein